LEITAPEDISTIPLSLLPSPNVGRTSYLNAVVEEVVRKNGGKVTKTIRGSAPSRGGWKRHQTKRVMQVWPKDLLLPAMSHLSFQRLPDANAPQRLVVRFQITEVLDPSADTFRKDLLRCLNLLLENVGTAELFPLGMSEADQLRRAYETIDWEPLPQGNRRDVAKAVFRRLGRRSEKFQKEVIDRLEVIDELNPQRRFQGGGHFITYLAAQFTDELVVFENLRLGAIYVMRGNWETLSKLTRSQLLVGHAGQFVRIVHQSGWKERLRQIVAEARGDNKDGRLL
jgi:hypothetical protein